MKALRKLVSVTLCAIMLGSIVIPAYAAELVNNGRVINYQSGQIENGGRFENTGILTNEGFFSNGGELTGQGIINWNAALTTIEGGEISTTLPSGSAGEAVTWEIDSDGTLLIRGNGAADDFSSTEYPWAKYAAAIKAVTIADGVTSLGENAFSGCEALEEVRIPDSVTAIAGDAFAECPHLRVIHYDGYRAEWERIAANLTLSGVQVLCEGIDRGVLNSGIEWALANNNSLSIRGAGDINDFGAVSYDTTYSWPKYDTAIVRTEYTYDIYTTEEQTTYHWNKYETDAQTTYVWNQYGTDTTEEFVWNKHEVVETPMYQWAKWDVLLATVYYWAVYTLKNDSAAPEKGQFIQNTSSLSPDTYPEDGEYQGRWYTKLEATREYVIGSIRKGNVSSTDPQAYPDDGMQDGNWYIKMHDETKMVQDKGDLIGSVRSSQRDAYPDKGIHEGFWYEIVSAENITVKGEAVLSIVTSDDENAYPNDGVGDDENWYVADTPQVSYRCGESPIGETSSADETAYPSDGQGDDGYWYVSTDPTVSFIKGETKAEPGSVVEQEDIHPHDGMEILEGELAYWFVLSNTEDVYGQGETSYGIVTSSFSDQYISNSRNEDGFWYGDRDEETTSCISIVGDPWEKYRGIIVHVDIADGITGIGNLVFYNMPELKTVSMASSVKSISETAFLGTEADISTEA